MPRQLEHGSRELQMEMHSTRVTWVGESNDGLACLQSAFQRWAQVELRVLASIDELLSAPDGGLPDRVVLACSSRLRFPMDDIVALASHIPEVPLAVATGNWFDGSRRTGAYSESVLTLPWYRWWDGWRDWTLGGEVGLYGPSINPSANLVVTKAFQESTGYQQRGLVIGNCFETTQGWSLVAHSLGAHAATSSIGNVQSSGAKRPEWVMWDDTCVDRSGNLETQLGEDLQLVGSRWPSAAKIVALTLPRPVAWRAALNAGAVAVIAKPSSGHSLRSVLRSLATGSSDFLSGTCTDVIGK